MEFAAGPGISAMLLLRLHTLRSGSRGPPTKDLEGSSKKHKFGGGVANKKGSFGSFDQGYADRVLRIAVSFRRRSSSSASSPPGNLQVGSFIIDVNLIQLLLFERYRLLALLHTAAPRVSAAPRSRIHDNTHPRNIAKQSPFKLDSSWPGFTSLYLSIDPRPACVVQRASSASRLHASSSQILDASDSSPTVWVRRRGGCEGRGWENGRGEGAARECAVIACPAHSHNERAARHVHAHGVRAGSGASVRKRHLVHGASRTRLGVGVVRCALCDGVHEGRGEARTAMVTQWNETRGMRWERGGKGAGGARGEDGDGRDAPRADSVRARACMCGESTRTTNARQRHLYAHGFAPSAGMSARKRHAVYASASCGGVGGDEGTRVEDGVGGGEVNGEGGCRWRGQRVRRVLHEARRFGPRAHACVGAETRRTRRTRGSDVCTRTEFAPSVGASARKQDPVHSARCTRVGAGALCGGIHKGGADAGNGGGEGDAARRARGRVMERRGGGRGNKGRMGMGRWDEEEACALCGYSKRTASPHVRGSTVGKRGARERESAWTRRRKQPARDAWVQGGEEDGRGGDERGRRAGAAHRGEGLSCQEDSGGRRHRRCCAWGLDAEGAAGGGTVSGASQGEEAGPVRDGLESPIGLASEGCVDAVVFWGLGRWRRASESWGAGHEVRSRRSEKGLTMRAGEPDCSRAAICKQGGGAVDVARLIQLRSASRVLMATGLCNTS
ncbi:hypothetical protein B0H16DRAFT_1471846 [Mycena metata]|uniref:Uncharacterized protein n=1 Tax=Mycena metata TaxID=1033252 RepID=A0AAD7MNG4_9AGAR|nr:hypothetical protein B0H16DRAFT_1471846 [Mycena metata]